MSGGGVLLVGDRVKVLEGSCGSVGLVGHVVRFDVGRGGESPALVVYLAGRAESVLATQWELVDDEERR